MKKPTADCKHARSVRETKLHYRADELGDGCWFCGGPLTWLEKVPVENLDSISMSEGDRQRLRDNPTETQGLLDQINQPEWYCAPCLKKHFDECRQARYVPADEVLAELSDRDWYIRNLQEDIAEVEACVVDCPYRERLAAWRRNLAREVSG